MGKRWCFYYGVCTGINQMGRPHSNKTLKSDQVGPLLKPIREKEVRKAIWRSTTGEGQLIGTVADRAVMAWNDSKLGIDSIEWRRIVCFDKPCRYHLVSYMISTSRQRVYCSSMSCFHTVQLTWSNLNYMLIKAKITSDVACLLRLSRVLECHWTKM